MPTPPANAGRVLGLTSLLKELYSDIPEAKPNFPVCQQCGSKNVGHLRLKHFCAAPNNSRPVICNSCGEEWCHIGPVLTRVDQIIHDVKREVETFRL